MSGPATAKAPPVVAGTPAAPAARGKVAAKPEEKWAQRPAQRPAQKPVQKPTQKPVGKVVAKAPGKMLDTPVAKPAATRPVVTTASKAAPSAVKRAAAEPAPVPRPSPPPMPSRSPKPVAPRRQVTGPVAAASADAAARPPVEPVLPTAVPPIDTAPAIVGGEPPNRLSILMVASEVLPYAKTGGLADVAAALPTALAALGHQVVVAMPRYRGVQVTGEVLTTFVLDIGAEHLHVQVFRERMAGGAVLWLVDIPALYDREGFYGVGSHDHPDNPRRFAALARAAFEAAIATGFTPDVVHAHDWQAGLAPVYLRTRYATHPTLGGVPSVFTIHNIAYPGLCDAGWLPALDLDWDLYTPQALEYFGQVSLLKAGINFSEKVTTVSRRYAEEILTPEFAYGLEGVLASRRTDLVGILNGIDAEAWNPATDRFLPAPYTADTLEAKRASKRALLQAYGLPSDEAALARPVVGMVSRMVAQKGHDLISSVATELPHLGARFVVLGTGEPTFETMWRRLAALFPDRIATRIGFDEGLSHLIEAGSDLFLMPSRFEPCGLNQMYSLRYGTLPLVRATGGLDDTVENYDPYTGRGTGFKFWEASGRALIDTLRWALRVYDHPEVWQRLQRAAMAGDFSWERSAAAYVEVYEGAMARTGRRRAAIR
ncbi:MAG: glycogen synthase GlgA [Vicinamibacteraceae bacterium]